MWIRPVSLPPYAHMVDLHLDRLSDSSNTFKEQCVELDVFQLRDKATRANFNNPLSSTLLDIRLTDRAHRSLPLEFVMLVITAPSPVSKTLKSLSL